MTTINMKDANELNRVIHDHECKEYKEGWKACNDGKLSWANPYGYIAYNGELNRLWEKGFYDCQDLWNYSIHNPCEISQDDIDNSFTITTQKDETRL